MSPQSITMDNNLVQEPSQAQQLLKGALVKLANLESDSYLLVISKCPTLCLNSVDASLQNTGDDSALVLHLHKFNVLVDDVLQLQTRRTHTVAPSMRQRLARAFKGARRKKAAVAKLVDSAHVLQVILQTISHHNATVSKMAAQHDRTDDSFKGRDTGHACEHAGESQRLIVTPNPTCTSSTDEADKTPSTSCLENSVNVDAKLDLTSHDNVSPHLCKPSGQQHVAGSGTPGGVNSVTVWAARGVEVQTLQGCQGSPRLPDEWAYPSASTVRSGRRASPRPCVGAAPVPKLLLGGLAPSSGPGPSPLAHSTSQSMYLSPSDPLASKLPQGWRLMDPTVTDNDSSQSVSFRDAVASHVAAQKPAHSLDECMISGSDSNMHTPVRRLGSGQAAERSTRFGRTHVSPSKLSSIVTPCSSISRYNAGTPGGSFTANMSYASPVAISTALLPAPRSIPGAPEASVHSQHGGFAGNQQETPGAVPQPTVPRAEAAKLWTHVTGKPASLDVSLPCYDFVTSLFVHCMSRPPSDIERTTVTRILNPFMYKEINFNELSELMTYTGPYIVTHDDSDSVCDSESDNMLCRFLNDVLSPTMRVLEPWFRPQLENDDLVTLQQATHGQYLVAASTFLGYFELAFVRARRNFLDMEENLLTPRCGEVVVMYLQILPSTRIRIVPTELVWLPAEVLETTYSCLRHVIHTLVLANLLHSPAVPQSDRDLDTAAPCSEASSPGSDGRPDREDFLIASGRPSEGNVQCCGTGASTGMPELSDVTNASPRPLSPLAQPGYRFIPALKLNTPQQEHSEPTCPSDWPHNLASKLLAVDRDNVASGGTQVSQEPADTCLDSRHHKSNWVVRAWDPVGAPAPSAQVTPESSPCKSQRSQCSPIPPSVSQNASPMRAGCTPMSSRAARRLEAQQLKLETQENSVDTGTPQEDYCESLPSRLGFVAAAPECEHFDSPAHMLPGPEPCIGGTPEPVEWTVNASFDDQLKPVSGGGNFHVLPLKALLGTTPPSTCHHQPLKFTKAVFSFSDNTEEQEPKSPGPATTLTLESIGQVSPPRIARGAGIAFTLPTQLAIETPLNSGLSHDATTDINLTTFNTTAEISATVNNFFDLRSPDNFERDDDESSADSEASCGPRLSFDCITPGVMSQVEQSLSPLPTDLLYSTVPQHRLQNYMQSFGGSDSGDETQESLKATSSQGDDSDSHSTGTNSDDEEEQEEQYSCLDSFKFELSAPGIKMPSLSFLVPDSKLHANAPQLFQRSCAGLADAPSRLGDGCAMLSERVSLHEKVQGDTECELEDSERGHLHQVHGGPGVAWFNPVFTPDQ